MKVEEIAEIRKELKSIFALILQQAIALDVLSKKKGLFAQAFHGVGLNEPHITIRPLNPNLGNANR